MKTKKYFPVLIILTAILCIQASAGTELPQFLNQGLIGRPYPALAQIEQLYAVVVPPDSEPNKDGLVWEELEAKIARKLKEAGIKHVKPCSLPIPQLRIDVDMLKLDDSQQYVFHIQTSLARLVTLPARRNPHFQVDVWKTEPLMQMVSAKNMPAKVTDVVAGQVEVFIQAYIAANPKDKQPAPADANDVSAMIKEQLKPPAKSVQAEYKYVASKNSEVFHKPDCNWAKKIKPENLTGYNNRNEALKAGKRPCKRCKP